MTTFDPPASGPAAVTAAGTTVAVSAPVDHLRRLRTAIKLSWWAAGIVVAFGVLGGLALATWSRTDYMTGQQSHPFVGVGLAVMALSFVVAAGLALPAAWAAAWQARAAAVASSHG